MSALSRRSRRAGGNFGENPSFLLGIWCGIQQPFSGKVCQTERSEDIPCPASSCPNRNIACKTVYFLPLLSCTVGVIKLRVRRQRGFPPLIDFRQIFESARKVLSPQKKAASRIYARRREASRAVSKFFMGQRKLI